MGGANKEKRVDAKGYEEKSARERRNLQERGPAKVTNRPQW